MVTRVGTSEAMHELVGQTAHDWTSGEPPPGFLWIVVESSFPESIVTPTTGRRHIARIEKLNRESVPKRPKNDISIQASPEVWIPMQLR